MFPAKQGIWTVAPQRKIVQEGIDDAASDEKILTTKFS